jgi:3D (Asp-Asp-Asp) domain-containing protein
MGTDHRTHSSDAAEADATWRSLLVRLRGTDTVPVLRRAVCRVLVVLPLLASLGCNSAAVDAQEPGVPASVARNGAAARAASPPAAATVVPAGRLREFSVTAYCTGTVTQSGARVKAGMAAADPRVLPVGSTVRVDGQGRAYDGIYTVTDTGRAIKGRELDLYVDSCGEAEQFGRRSMKVAVIRLGWDPTATPGGPVAR